MVIILYGAIYRATDTPGYIYTLNGAQSTISNNDYSTGIDTLDYKGYNSMYAGRNGKEGEYYYWWLASPLSSTYNDYVCMVSGGYGVCLNRSYYDYALNVCPLVSLKQGISIEIEE